MVMQPVVSRLRSQLHLHHQAIMIRMKNYFLYWAVSLPQRTGSPLGDGLACFCGETTVCASYLRGSGRAQQLTAKLVALPWLLESRVGPHNKSEQEGEHSAR